MTTSAPSGCSGSAGRRCSSCCGAPASSARSTGCPTPSRSPSWPSAWLLAGGAARAAGARAPLGRHGPPAAVRPGRGRRAAAARGLSRRRLLRHLARDPGRCLGRRGQPAAGPHRRPGRPGAGRAPDPHGSGSGLALGVVGVAWSSDRGSPPPTARPRRYSPAGLAACLVALAVGHRRHRLPEAARGRDPAGLGDGGAVRRGRGACCFAVAAATEDMTIRWTGEFVGCPRLAGGRAVARRGPAAAPAAAARNRGQRLEPLLPRARRPWRSRRTCSSASGSPRSRSSASRITALGVALVVVPPAGQSFWDRMRPSWATRGDVRRRRRPRCARSTAPGRRTPPGCRSRRGASRRRAPAGGTRRRGRGWRRGSRASRRRAGRSRPTAASGR